MYCNIFKLLDDASFSNEIAANKLYSSYHLFLTLRIPYLGKLRRGNLTKLWTNVKNFPRRNFQKSETYKKVLAKFCLVTKIFPDKYFPNRTAF